MPIAASVAERPRAPVLESVALCKSRATPASVWAVSASIRCRLVHLPLRDTHVIESERTTVGKHGADLWKPVVLRSLRHHAGHWRSHGVRAWLAAPFDGRLQVDRTEVPPGCTP